MVAFGRLGIEQRPQQDERGRVGGPKVAHRVEALGAIQREERLQVVGGAQLLGALDQGMVRRQRAQRGGGVRAASGADQRRPRWLAVHPEPPLLMASSAAVTICSSLTSTASVAGPNGTNESTARTLPSA